MLFAHQVSHQGGNTMMVSEFDDSNWSFASSMATTLKRYSPGGTLGYDAIRLRELKCHSSS